MAGAGYKLFNTGDVLTAAQVNTYLNEQTVMVFASSTARTTALSGVLAEGMMSYLQDTNSVEVYNGTSWVNVGNAGDITEVQAGVGISIASGTGPIPVITNSSTDLITTAGDILYGTAADTMARLGIGTAGQVLKVNSGATAPEWGAAAAAAFVGVKLFLPADQTIANTTAAAIAFGAGSESIDTDAFHDTSTNNTRITIPVGKAGKYLVIAAVNWVGNGTGVREMWVQKGASGRVMQADMNVSGTASLTQTGIVILSLAEADYIQLYVEQNSGGNLNVNGDFAQQTRFEAYFIGA